jgi:hypothetical protein
MKTAGRNIRILSRPLPPRSVKREARRTRKLTMFESYPHSCSLRIALIAFPTLVTATVAYAECPVFGMQSSHRSALSGVCENPPFTDLVPEGRLKVNQVVPGLRPGLLSAVPVRQAQGRLSGTKSVNGGFSHTLYRPGPNAKAVDENGSDDISVATDRAIKNGCYEPDIPGGTHSV